MSRFDIRPVDVGGLSNLPTYKWAVQSGTGTLIKAGEPVKIQNTSASSVVYLNDGDPTGSQIMFVGIAADDSTDTSTATGFVNVYVPTPGIVYEAKAKTASAADTEAEINNLRGKRVLLDLTSGVWTVDTAATDATVNGILIVGGDPLTSRIHFMIRSNFLAIQKEP